MASLKNGGVPACRRHKARNSAAGTIAGHDSCLGLCGSASSRRRYAALMELVVQFSGSTIEIGHRQQPKPLPGAGVDPEDQNRLTSRDAFQVESGDDPVVGKAEGEPGVSI